MGTNCAGERGGSVVECRTPEREVRGSRPTAAVLCPWARHFTPRKYWLITQEAMAPSRHDWKIVDWDVKPQHNQPTNCAPLVADLFLFCYERDFMTSLSDVKQAEIIEAFKSTSRYLDDLLNIDNPYFEGMVNRIYPPELQLNKANTSDTEAPFLDLHLFISNGFVSSKIYDKRDDFDFDIVNFPFFGWWRSPFCLLRGLYFSTYSVC